VINIKPTYYLIIVFAVAIVGAAIFFTNITGQAAMKYRPYQGYVMQTVAPQTPQFTSGRFQSPCEMCGCPPQTEYIGYKGLYYDCRCPEVQDLNRYDFECLWSEEMALEKGYSKSKCAHVTPQYVETRSINAGVRQMY